MLCYSLSLTKYIVSSMVNQRTAFIIHSLKLAFLGRRQLVTEIFFQSPDGKCGCQKVSIELFFCFTAKHKHMKFFKTFFGVKIYIVMEPILECHFTTLKDSRRLASKFWSPTLHFQSHWWLAGCNFGLCNRILVDLY